MIDFSKYPPLVAQSDLPDGFTVDDEALRAAGDDVRGECGWHIAPRFDDTLWVDGDGSSLLTLPSLLLTEPTEITDANGAAITGWSWSEIGQLTGSWPAGFRSVKVSVAHGLLVTPPNLVAVVVDMLRDRTTAAEGTSVSAVSLDGANVTFGNPYSPRGSSSNVGVRRELSDAYGHILRRYSL
ncbi:hypothetical protein [Williamsia soli]|uniref:hypothetical protein n=1 Tax=Williamsia soli TaxID=364929 RepID=UPI001A9F2A25|nr:hypothetical protein [Williamsia soli]